MASKISFTVAARLKERLDIIGRAAAFLTTLSKYPETFEALVRKGGYSDEEQEKGSELLLKLMASSSKVGSDASPNPARDAVKELADWQREGVPRIRAILRHNHPEQEAFVFEGLEPASGGDCVPIIGTILSRLQSLQNASDRQSTRDSDRAAIAVLDKRGIDAAMRDRLSVLVKQALKETSANVDRAAVVERAHEPPEEVLAMRRWLGEWKATARAVIPERAALIRLGAVRRRRTKTVVDPSAPLSLRTEPVTGVDDVEGPPSSQQAAE